MAPHLRVLAGPDPSSLTPITTLVNSGKAHAIRSDGFEGQVAMYIKGFPGAGEAHDSYFAAPERTGVTWSIQVHGRFLHPHSTDDILFGNTFDKALNLPWGSGPALKLMKHIDSTLEHDLNSSTRPWALSPLISTMPYLAIAPSSDVPAVTKDFPPARPIAENTARLAQHTNGTPGTLDTFKNADKRRAFFRDVARRNEVTFGPEDVLTTDFCYGYLEFHPSLALRLPGGVSLDLTRHWDGQQVRFVCCERGRGGEGSEPWGRMFWCIAIEPAEDSGEEEAAGEASEAEAREVPGNSDID